jgi:hypothetical protein
MKTNDKYIELQKFNQIQWTSLMNKIKMFT